ncbi:MAG: 4-hydroxyphenylacetate 3-hydroxylase N-terminal domain-containing protein, partial [Chloroflexota bacterium]
AQKDSRSVYIDGELIKDVTQDPRLRGGAQTLAELYDLQHQPDRIEEMTYISPHNGQQAGLTFIEPRTQDELTRRSRCMKHIADHTFGMFGRSPDYMNVILAAMRAGADFFDEGSNGKGGADHVRNYVDSCRDNDLTLTHVNVNPAVDRSKPVHQQEKDLACKVVKETDAGFYVSGARMVATLGPLADELLFMPSGSVRAAPEAADYALMFALPTATDGLKIVCRPTLAPQSPAHFLDHPLSSRFDETDSFIIFDNVFVPWERAFIYRDPQQYNSYYRYILSHRHQLHQSLIRGVAKLEFLTGLACYLAKSTKVDGFPNVKNILARALVYTETQRVLVGRLDETAVPSPWGTYMAQQKDLDTAQMLFHEQFAEVVDTVRTIGAGGIVAMPSYAELAGPAGELVQQYYASANLDSEARIRLFRLAADASISALSGRQVLYERYYAGDPVRRNSGIYDRFPKDDLLGLVERALDDMVKRGRNL